jgi:hypothetical protein
MAGTAGRRLTPYSGKPQNGCCAAGQTTKNDGLPHEQAKGLLHSAAMPQIVSYQFSVISLQPDPWGRPSFCVVCPAAEQPLLVPHE